MLLPKRIKLVFAVALAILPILFFLPLTCGLENRTPYETKILKAKALLDDLELELAEYSGNLSEETFLEKYKSGVIFYHHIPDCLSTPDGDLGRFYYFKTNDGKFEFAYSGNNQIIEYGKGDDLTSKNKPRLGTQK